MVAAAQLELMLAEAVGKPVPEDPVPPPKRVPGGDNVKGDAVGNGGDVLFRELTGKSVDMLPELAEMVLLGQVLLFNRIAPIESSSNLGFWMPSCLLKKQFWFTL